MAVDSTNPWIRLAALAERQGGHIAAWQARHLGVGLDAFHHRAGASGWTSVHRGVWRLAGVPISRRGTMWAALLSTAPVVSAGAREQPASGDSLTPPSLAITGWSGADVYGFDRYQPLRPQLLADAARYTARPGVRLVRSRLPVEQFITEHAGVPVTLPWRVVWDAAHLTARGEGPPLRVLADLVVNFDRRRVLAIELLLAIAEEPVAFGLPSVPPSLFRRVTSMVRPGFSHSGTESKGRRIAKMVCARAGLTLQPRPFLVRGPAGNRLAEVDLAIPQLRYGGEVDGPHHDEPSVRAADQRRDSRLRRIADWTINRYPVALIDEGGDVFEKRFERDLRAFLLRRGSTAA